MKALGFLGIFISLVFAAFAQPSSHSNLSKNISLRAINQPLGNVLDKISESGRFYFSYSGNALKRDSIVTISAQNRAVRNVLDELFKGQIEYKESGSYVILRSIVGRFEVVPENIISEDNSYEIEGFVLDSKSGERVKEASVYERKLLKSTLTDDKGYFKLRFKGEHQGIILTVSKDNFRDTSIHFLSSISVSPNGVSRYKAGEEAVLNLVERLRVGRFLTSSRQRIQSLNIPDFLANSPFQASLLPGLSSHGMLSSQIVNRGSLNVLGGYTAGVNGVEIAGLFNINKKDVNKVQVAGLLNLVGGSVNGIQTSGLFNIVLDSLKGVQVAGLFNSVSKGADAVQVAGLINHVRDSLDGVQVAGLINFSERNLTGAQVAGLGNIALRQTDGTQVSGLWNFNLRDLDGAQVAGLLNIGASAATGAQVAGLANFTRKTVDGVQISALFNYARRMHGTQIGLINVSDSSSGYSIGLLNLVRQGYHRIGLTSNEMSPANFSIKTGNAKLFTILSAGMHFSNSQKLSYCGIGMGHDFLLKSERFSLGIELHTLWLNNQYLDDLSIASRFQPNLHIKLVKGIGISAGPSYSLLYGTSEKGLDKRNNIIPNNAHTLAKNNSGWLGWNFGITFF